MPPSPLRAFALAVSALVTGSVHDAHAATPDPLARAFVPAYASVPFVRHFSDRPAPRVYGSGSGRGGPYNKSRERARRMRQRILGNRRAILGAFAGAPR